MNKKSSKFIIVSLKSVFIVVGIVGFIWLSVFFFSISEDTAEIVFSIFMIAVLGFLYFFCGGLIGKIIIEKIRFSSSANLTAFVKVVSKSLNTETHYVGVIPQIIEKHLVTFEFPGGARQHFIVNIANYNTILENDSGILTYRVSKNLFFFVKFERQT